MKKVAGEWKLSVIGRAGDGDDDIQQGYSAWP